MNEMELADEAARIAGLLSGHPRVSPRDLYSVACGVLDACGWLRLRQCEKRLQIDPGGSDKIDELEQAIQFLRAEVATLKEKLEDKSCLCCLGTGRVVVGKPGLEHAEPCPACKARKEKR